MKKEFKMVDLGLMNYLLGLEVTQVDECIFICQHKYATNILQSFRMDKWKPSKTPISLGTKLTKDDDGPTVNSTLYKRMVHSLMYLIETRPDLMYVVSLISIFMESPKESRWKFGKIILRYVAGKLGYGIWYTHTPVNTLIGYTNNDFAWSIDDRKSTSCYAFQLGTNMISWASQKQPLSTCLLQK